MELLGPSGLGVHDCHVVQEGAAELVQLHFRRLLAKEHKFEDSFDFDLLVIGGVECFQAVVAEFASHEGEEIVTDLQSLDKVGIRVDFLVRSFAKFLKIFLI